MSTIISQKIRNLVKMTENMDVNLDLMSSSGLRVIEQTKKRLFSPAQKEKIKRRSLMQAGVTEASEGENEPGLYRGRYIRKYLFDHEDSNQ